MREFDKNTVAGNDLEFWKSNNEVEIAISIKLEVTVA
jgi:hypothetical protein